MKKVYYIISLILISAISFIFGYYITHVNTKNTPNENTKQSSFKPPIAEFHIRVKNYYDCDNWCIVFTYNDWRTSETIMETFDLTYEPWNPWVCFQPLILQSEQEAINLAKKLNTYHKCLVYNELVRIKYTKQKEFRKKNRKPKLVVIKKVCEQKTIDVY
ncbi:MAG: hypothetical protein PHS33_08225 [Candidatus Omnitrophica bacterium]|nr:hypothetical protein [Candidatus Omnitrophota bacterium]